MKLNQAAFDVGQLAERLSQGYYAHLAAISVATDPRAAQLAPQIQPGQIVPVADVKRKDGTAHVFHFLHFLSLASSDDLIAAELERVWFAGTLLRVGDALAQHQYFDRAPELELLRHLRNGIAHGNRFRIDNPSSLTKFPAHNRLAWIRSDLKSDFEIEPALNGTEVLFSFMEPGDILDLLMSIGLYLIRMGNGDPLRP
ncbi:hypothetical protein [Pseudogulbenkiania subflava]|uniref:Uncharacterized protein n=1 Tax=Pseudogulbenkiania subflava DSM 22618 TaxID=1123014 RepID=A0A1Y6B8E8_9NEIS|nr:hypothetical protein [Pseudogulbenkiania subflava]SME98225.1 hypothetical protein SAMN02745746_00496 [Pseudogulbenkiania subflava DSM 22618]